MESSRAGEMTIKFLAHLGRMLWIRSYSCSQVSTRAFVATGLFVVAAASA